MRKYYELFEIVDDFELPLKDRMTIRDLEQYLGRNKNTITKAIKDYEGKIRIGNNIFVIEISLLKKEEEILIG